LIAMPPDRDPLVCHDSHTGRSVFIAPRRDDRPGDAVLAAGLAAATGVGPEVWCPFCAGNESRTPPAHLRAPADPAITWQARIIPNRYPFVDVAAGGSQESSGSPAYGVHDVVIESARHETSILGIEPSAWQTAWILVQQRLADLSDRGDLAWGTVFKNSGPRAGASLEHVHSQLVAVDFVPPAVRAEFAAAASRSDPFADLLAEAFAEGRIVHEADGLVAFVPAAARQPFETWILPAVREPHFHAAPPARAAALAAFTQRVVGRLADVLPGTDFNWWLHEAAWSGPLADGPAADRWHWHLELLPRATELAGFELATGCHITALPPVEAAARLRGR
jgi:UDPglucose--hexose-1-phosphate uridylyltransferase